MVYHLHGYTFYVVGARKFGRSVSLQELKSLDDRGQLFSRNLDCTVAKDTVVVPKFGAVALRFKADNPGNTSFVCYRLRKYSFTPLALSRFDLSKKKISRLFHFKILPINNRGKNVPVEKITIPDD